ncbi:MAG: DUF547 domain-containing protein [Thermodesulfobacteriota bacterium]
MNTHSLRLALLLGLLVCFSLPAAAQEPSATPGPIPDHVLFTELLSRNVKDGVVSYKGFQADLPRFEAYLEQMAQVDPATLSNNDRFAFFINLYNAWTIRLILTKYPDLRSIKDLGGFFGPWKMDLVKLNGQTVTLDHVEHGILRPEFKDPRVHFAINCASKGCPKLRSEAYVGARLSDQLDDAVSRFINDPERTYIADGRLYVSRIFKWFAQDFDKDPVSFVRRYAKGDLATRLAATGDGVSVKYLSYDWSLNGN